MKLQKQKLLNNKLDVIRESHIREIPFCIKKFPTKTSLGGIEVLIGASSQVLLHFSDFLGRNNERKLDSQLSCLPPHLHVAVGKNLKGILQELGCAMLVDDYIKCTIPLFPKHKVNLLKI